MRAEPSIDAAIVACVSDGTSLTIVEGPQMAGARNWWRVSGPSDEGWVAEEFLVAQ
jgi:hypothetical protein